MTQLTPLLEDLLSIVRDTCAPAATGWQQALLQRLYVEFYTPVGPGVQITAEDEEKQHLRLLAVERRISARESLPSADGGTNWTN
jgi:hypothetical protein